jgi:hypothetical protein
MLRIGCVADCSSPADCADSLDQAPSRRTRETMGGVLSNQIRYSSPDARENEGT